MLERTSSAIEQCSRMQLLPVLESSRRLPSGFWKHAGVSIELSPAWNALIRSQNTPKRRHASPSAFPGPLFLDFLYPNSGPNLLQPLSAATSDAQNHPAHETRYRYPQPSTQPGGDARMARHAPHQRLATLSRQTRRRQSTVFFSRHSSRASSPRRFSTIAVDSVYTRPPPMPIPAIPHTIDPSDPWELTYRLKRVLATKGAKPSLVWGIYRQLPEAERAEVKSEVMVFLSKRGSRQHISQVLSWIPDTSPSNIDSDTFALVLRCHLRTRRYTSALRYFESGIEPGHSEKCFEEIINFAFERQAWRLLIRTWAAWNNQRPSSLGHFQFERVRNMPRLLEQVVSLSNHVKEHTQRFEKIEAADQPDYAQSYIDPSTDDLIRRVTRWVLSRGFKYDRALALLGTLDRTPLFLLYMLQRLRAQEFEHARELYTIYKAREDHVLDRELLNRMFHVFASTNDTAELRQLYRDFKKTHGQLDATMLQNFLQYYSAHGDVGSIHRLWPFFLRAIGSEPESIQPAMFNPILTAFAVLGDVQKVKSLIGEMQQQYGIDMGVLGHQAVLRAYVCANDYAGSVSAFQELCRHSMPDRQALLAVLSIAASYGDLSLVLSTYDALRKMGLKDDPEALKYLIEAYAKNDMLDVARRICDERLADRTATTDLMNTLLQAYASRADIGRVKYYLSKMRQQRLPWTGPTYRHLLHALVAARHVHHAYRMLRVAVAQDLFQVKPEHYAVVLSGAMQTGEFWLAQRVCHQMSQATTIPNSLESLRVMVLSTHWWAQRWQQMPNSVSRHPPTLMSGKTLVDHYEKVAGAAGQDALRSHERMNLSFYRRGDMNLPHRHQDTVGKLVFVLAQLKERDTIDRVMSLYASSTNRPADVEHLPINILSSLMYMDLFEGKFDDVKTKWSAVFQKANAEADAHPSGTRRVLPSCEFILDNAFKVMRETLVQQRDPKALVALTDEVVASGYKLRRRNWNMVVQVLARLGYARDAFRLCEHHLMATWQGWKWQRPFKTRTMTVSRRKRLADINPRSVRPLSYTIFILARVYADLRRAESWSTDAAEALLEIESSCRLCVKAITSMRYSGVGVESELFNSDGINEDEDHEQEIARLARMRNGNKDVPVRTYLAGDFLQATMDEKLGIVNHSKP